MPEDYSITPERRAELIAWLRQINKDRAPLSIGMRVPDIFNAQGWNPETKAQMEFYRDRMNEGLPGIAGEIGAVSPGNWSDPNVLGSHPKLLGTFIRNGIPLSQMLPTLIHEAMHGRQQRYNRPENDIEAENLAAPFAADVYLRPEKK